MAFGLGKKDDKKKLDIDQPSEEEMKLSQDISQKFEVARSAKAPKVETWKKCLQAYNSEYFKSMNKPDYKSDEISNFIFATIETIKPIMTDNDPRIVALPKTPKGVEKVDKIQNIFDSEWQRAQMGVRLPQAITVALQIGTAIFGMFWDGKDDNGLGNVKPTLINPFNLFPDPMATSIDDAEYIIYATYRHVNQLKQKYPGKANLLNSGTINFSELVSSGQDVSNVQNQVLVLECWMRDYTTISVEEIEDYVGDDGKPAQRKIKKSNMKYPKGRVVTCCPDLNVILEDKKNPYNDAKFPFKLIKCYDVPFEFWGKGEIEQLLSPQTYINDLTNQIIDNAKLTANMPWVIDKNSGIGVGQLTNRPGLIVRKNPGSEVKRLQPPAMPNYVAEMVDTLKRDIEIISGIHDVTQGRKPGSVSAASAIIALQEAAQARIRLKVKLMEHSLGDLGHMWYDRIRQFWLTDRFARFEESEGQYQLMQVTPDDLDVDVDIIIVAGSTMPLNKNAMLDLMIRLAQTVAEDGLPMVDRETVLQFVTIPDKKKVLEKFAQRVQEQQSAQAGAEEAAVAQQQEQMLAQMEQQFGMEKMKQDSKLQQEMMKMQGQKEMREPDDAMLEQIIQLLMANPELLKQLMIQIQQQ